MSTLVYNLAFGTLKQDNHMFQLRETLVQNPNKVFFPLFSPLWVVYLIYQILNFFINLSTLLVYFHVFCTLFLGFYFWDCLRFYSIHFKIFYGLPSNDCLTTHIVKESNKRIFYLWKKKLALEYYWDKMQSRHQDLHPITHTLAQLLFIVFSPCFLCAPTLSSFHTP